jgi:hypothetical protein
VLQADHAVRPLISMEVDGLRLFQVCSRIRSAFLNDSCEWIIHLIGHMCIPLIRRTFVVSRTSKVGAVSMMLQLKALQTARCKGSQAPKTAAEFQVLETNT